MGPDALPLDPQHLRPAPWRRLAVALALFGVTITIGLLQPSGIFGPVDGMAMRIVEHVRLWPIGPVLTQAALWLDALGEGGGRLWIATAIGFFLARAGRPGAMIWLLAADIGGMILNQALKMLFLAPRPDMIEHLAIVTSASFPSGHAAGAMALYGAIGMVLRHRLIWIFCGVMILATGTSRVWLGVHWPSDVMAGWIEGLALLVAMSLLLPAAPESRSVSADI